MIYLLNAALAHIVDSNPIAHLGDDGRLADKRPIRTNEVSKKFEENRISYSEGIRDLTKDNADISFVSYPKVSMIYGIDNATKIILLCILICLCILVISTTLKCFENILVVRKRNSRDLVKQLDF